MPVRAYTAKVGRAAIDHEASEPELRALSRGYRKLLAGAPTLWKTRHPSLAALGLVPLLLGE
jgi:hypothetical protein